MEIYVITYEVSDNETPMETQTLKAFYRREDAVSFVQESAKRLMLQEGYKICSGDFSMETLSYLELICTELGEEFIEDSEYKVTYFIESTLLEGSPIS